MNVNFIPLVAAALVATGTAAAAQAPAPTDPTAQQNVRQSGQYEQLLRSNAGFRNKRMQQECGSIDDPQLHASCVASFGADAGAPAQK